MSVMIFDLWNKVGKDLPPVWLDDDASLLKDLFHVLHGSATFVDIGYRQSLIQFCVEIVVGKPGFVPGFAACRERRSLAGNTSVSWDRDIKLVSTRSPPAPA
ncbi:hypothetical protein ACFFTN_09180 [Aminobacter aganoensis]|uniref:Uncharacterized protein n=1 Tax=Aminobacter aganoensis TaxID=83264 RepID=A0A7X0F833_9HYPH|nr:hypothetical protein [Aminobacter aganoensis]MBB6354849.1 hypothetical protein [Aminobacter aganoensis]